MTRLLSSAPAGSARAPVGASSWTVSGVDYDNSAVKFWSGLLDEVVEDFSGADAITVEGPCDDLLIPDMLDPANLFSEELEAMTDDESMDETMRELTQELELIGPPPMVHATVMAGTRTVCSRDLPDEVIDAELLPIFLVWPLEWAGLSEFGWNRRQVNGQFTACDPGRGLTYDVRFALDNQHVREGLFHRKLAVWFERKSPAAP